jgi:alkanesulfonate monooxygenase SsuD/methylene tetrahydromethanopterin reductase-like flavin-dependent oxidoreductase (luciferase family)
MKMNLFVRPTIPATNEDRERLRPIDRNTERYQRMIDEIRQLAVAADELGVHSISTTEHHFHTEGGEANPDPITLLADLGARTKRLVLAPLSIVLPTHNPLRVAESIALLDQLTQGRVCVALARGYQKRWIQILGQGLPVASGAGDAGDVASLDRMEEYQDILLKAWTEDAFDHNGAHFQVPYPYDTGVEGWPAVDWTRRYGAEGEIDDAGVIRKIGVVPPPFHRPHPDVWVVSGGPQRTLARAAERQFMPVLSESRPERFREAALSYQRLSTEAGHALGLGHRLAANRRLTVGPTEREAFELAASTTGYEWHHYFNEFGFGEMFRAADEDQETYPPPLKFASPEATMRRVNDSGHSLTGTVDQVKRKLEDLRSCHGGDGDLEYFSWTFFYQGNIPIEAQIEQLETVMTKVWPDVAD